MPAPPPAAVAASTRSSLVDPLLWLLPPVVTTLHAVLSPFTKVEESFTLHALHDFLYRGFGVSSHVRSPWRALARRRARADARASSLASGITSGSRARCRGASCRRAYCPSSSSPSSRSSRLPARSLRGCSRACSSADSPASARAVSPPTSRSTSSPCRCLVRPLQPLILSRIQVLTFGLLLLNSAGDARPAVVGLALVRQSPGAAEARHDGAAAVHPAVGHAVSHHVLLVPDAAQLYGPAARSIAPFILVGTRGERRPDPRASAPSPQSTLPSDSS